MADRTSYYDFVNTWLPLADQCYDRAVFCAPKDRELLFKIADYWVWQSRLLAKKDGPVLRGSGEMFREDGIIIFQHLFKKTFRRYAFLRLLFCLCNFQNAPLPECLS